MVKIQFNAPTWREPDALLARPFFESDTGQKFLEMLRYRRPAITEKKSDGRRTQHEKREGYESCLEEILQLLREQPEK